MTIKIGTCGWSRIYQAVSPKKREGKSVLQVYAEYFPVVEINTSYYNYHRVSTYKNWRKETPKDFEFTLKAHQDISHKNRLKPSDETIEAFNKMKERCEACRASLLLIQTPGSFDAKDEHLERANKFFKIIKKDGLMVVWETRGKSWDDPKAREKLAQLLERHSVSHVVDIMKREPVYTSDIVYIRLHGLPGYNLQYKYTNDNLRTLYKRVKPYEEEGKVVYIFYNNYAMYTDGMRFIQYLKTGRMPPSPFGPRAVKLVTRNLNFPVSREELLKNTGKWYCWVGPKTRVRMAEVYKFFEEKLYSSADEVEKEAERIWSKTGFPMPELE